MAETRERTVAQFIAETASALAQCEANGREEWASTWREVLDAVEREYLPSGAGIDSGCTIDLGLTTGDRIVIRVPYHYMNGVGYYCGWADHTVEVTPTFGGILVTCEATDEIPDQDDEDGPSDASDYIGDTIRHMLEVAIPTEDERAIIDACRPKSAV